MAQSASAVDPPRNTGQQDEQVCFPGADRRRKVSDLAKSLSSVPYLHIVRLEVWKRCCEQPLKQATAFLLDGGEDSEYCHYATAGHVLACVTHMRYATEVSIFSAADDKEVLAKIRIGQSDQPGYYVANPSYVEVIQDQSKCRAHDFGVIAVRRDEVKPKFIRAPCFRAPSELPENRACLISGFPAVMDETTRPPPQNKHMYEHGGDLHYLDSYHHYPVPLWKHFIDTSGGQSGSPVLLRDDPTVVLGMHIGYGTESAHSVEATCNLAVVLTQEIVGKMLAGFGTQRGTQDVELAIRLLSAWLSLMHGCRFLPPTYRLSMMPSLSKNAIFMCVRACVCVCVCVSKWKENAKRMCVRHISQVGVKSGGAQTHPRQFIIDRKALNINI